MKNLITLLTCLFILSPNLVLSETINELVERGGLQYMKFSDVPFTGKTMGKTQATFRDGKEHGLGSRTTTTDSYCLKCITRTEREKVLGLVLKNTELCLRHSREPSRTV